jgi:hypothetical protein
MRPPPRPASFASALALGFALAIACSGLAACDAGPPQGAPPAVSASAPTAPASAAQAQPPGREIAGAQQILVAYKGAERAPKTVTRTKEQARKRAEEALAKLKDKGEAFNELVKEYSDDEVTRPANGATGNFERGAMPEAFERATFALAVGEVSDVVETPLGFHIIKRTR